MYTAVCFCVLVRVLCSFGVLLLCAASTKPHYCAVFRVSASCLLPVAQVAFNFNKSQVSNIGPDKDKAPPVLPLRYTIVAAPDNTSCLSRERQAAVQELLSNTDESHKAVFGATLSQTSHFLACVEQQLSAEQQQQ